MFITITFGLLTLLSFVLTLWQYIAARRFPLHRRQTTEPYTPPVTLLKPLKGVEPDTENCLRSWLTQEYSGQVQALFGVASAEDPVCEVVRKLIAEFPNADAELVICPEALGANAKVSSLIQIQRRAKHEVIVVSDADVRVPADFLTQSVAFLREPAVGLVNCFYQLANPANLAMNWEAVAINADFWSQVLQSKSLKPIDFALGAVMITRRQQLEEIGGFTALVDYLADDYQLGHQIARKGHRIEICPVVVECWSAPMTWGEVWAHQLRWARTIRVCQPTPYFFSILSNATLWPALWFILAPSNFVFACAAFCWGTRMATGLDLQYRLTRKKSHLLYDWLIMLKDVLQVGLWALAFLGKTVVWRKQRYHVQPGGKLVKV